MTRPICSGGPSGLLLKRACASFCSAICRSSALGALITDQGAAVCFRPAGRSPPGYTWVDIFADVAAGHRGAALAVGSFLRSMANEHKGGRLEGFRILSGQHWMSVAENDEAATTPPQSSHWLRGSP